MQGPGQSLATWMVLGAAGLAAAAAAQASQGSDALDSLAKAVAARTAESGAEEGALARAAGLLEGASGALAGDLRIAARAGLLLDRAFPGDGEFLGLLDAARTAFRGEVGGQRGEFAALAEALGDSAPGRRASRALARVDGFLDAADSLGEPTPALRALAGAARAIERGRKSLSIEGDSWLVAFINGRPFLSTLSANGYYTATEFRVDAWASRSWLDVARDRFRLITLFVGASGPGTYPLERFAYPSPYRGEVVFANPACSGQYGCGTYVGDGSITIDSIGPMSEGSFEFTAEGFYEPIVVSDGRFRIRMD